MQLLIFPASADDMAAFERYDIIVMKTVFYVAP